MKILIEIFCQKLVVSNIISAFLDHLKPKVFFAGQPWWQTFFKTALFFRSALCLQLSAGELASITLLNWVSRKLHPGKQPPVKLSPLNSPLENSPLDSCLPKNSPRKTAPSNHHSPLNSCS